MLRIILTFGVFLSIIYESKSLNCYACVGPFSSDCARNKTSSMAIQICDSSISTKFHHIDAEDLQDEEVLPSVQRLRRHILLNSDPPQLNTRCIYMTLKESADSSALVIRECVKVPRGVDLCTILKQRANIDECRICDGNLCNL